MILENVVIWSSTEPTSIQIGDDGMIRAVSNAIVSAAAARLRFDQAIAFPGLINSHDHLDFNNFPLLGNRIYDNYMAWGKDIHVVNKEIIGKILRIPQSLRVQWSLYKNLLNGITTVVQHGERFDVGNELIDVFQDCISIHSVRNESRWKLRLNKPRLNRQPIVIHIGEGTNEDAFEEINDLIRSNFLRKKLIGIHAIAMNTRQAASFKALIWCPDSNYFLFGKTADIPALKKKVPILFGTDSTLTADWSIWKQLRIAAGTGYATAGELYEMLTGKAASVWGMSGKGEIRPGALADLVIARNKSGQFTQSFLALEPEDILLVLHRGRIRMFDEALLPQVRLCNVRIDEFSKARIGNCGKFVFGDLPKLVQDIRNFYPEFDPVDLSVT